MKNKSPDTPQGFLAGLWRLAKWSFFFVLFLIVVAGLGGIFFYLHISKDLPKLDKIEDYRPEVMAEVFDDSGQKIGEFWTEARILTPIAQIPPLLIKAFISSEDERFFDHHGVDPYGILRAFWRNFKSGEVTQGASTITQQVTKNLLLTPERTYDRKIKEAILATLIEQNLSKEQILYIYLNEIYFGNRAYGVAAAARNYFHKNLDQLNLAEMAMIAGLAKAPSIHDPVKNPERAKLRMFYVLDRMVEEGYVTPAQAQEAKALPLHVYKAGTDKDFNYKYAPYFVEAVRRDLQQKYGTEKLYTSGWKIYTTANLAMNQEAQRAVLNGVENFSKRFGYRGPLKHLEGQKQIDDFLKQYHFQQMEELDELNYYDDPGLKKAMLKATPIQADRIYEAVITQIDKDNLQVQVGNTSGTIASADWTWARNSSHKGKLWKASPGDVIEVRLKTPSDKDSLSVSSSKNFSLFQSPEVQSALFSYEAFTGAVKAVIGGQDYKKSEFNRATQALLQPGSSIKPLIYAAALDKGYTPGTIISDSPISYEESPGKFWSPRNYGGKYYGPTAFRHALVNSRNVVTVRILMDIGTHYVAGFMRKLGLTTPIYKYYSMALGANEVKLAELARAYGSFVTGGILPDIHYVEKIVDPKGSLVEEYQKPNVELLVSYQEVKDLKKEADAPAGPIGDGEEANSKANSAKQAQKAEASPNPVKNWEEMSTNSTLEANFSKLIEKDDLLLTDYERKLLTGDYIPPGYVISPKTAMTMVSILRDVVRAGTGTRVRALGKPAAGKTGTTNEATDAWFIGFTPNLVTGVWVGFDEERKSLGHGVTGGSTAAPIWLAFMEKATQNYPTLSFNFPKGLDLAIYEAPIQTSPTAGDAELGDTGVGTGIATSNTGPSGPAPSSAEFFTQDLE